MRFPQARQTEKRPGHRRNSKPRRVIPHHASQGSSRQPARRDDCCPGWSKDQAFPGRIFISEKGPAVETARDWGHRNTIWADGSWLDDGGGESGVRIALSRGVDGPPLPPEQQQGGLRRGDLRHPWRAKDLRSQTGVRLSLHHLRGFGGGHQPNPVASGPGHGLARAVIEICSRLVSRGNEVTVLWVLAHVGTAGNEEADRRQGGRGETHP